MTEDPRIREIRAELASWHADGPPVPRDVLNRIRAILERPAPAPRVFFPGDDIPSDRLVVAEHGVIYAYDANEQSWDDIGGPVVEIPVPTGEEWQAAVDRARVERGDAP